MAEIYLGGVGFILVPDAPDPVGALGKQGCHLHTGRRLNKPPNTQRFPHSAHYILFRLFVAILPDGQQVVIDKQQVGVFIIIYMCLQIRMNARSAVACVWRMPERSRGSMNTRAKVISILLLVSEGLCAHLG